MLHHANMFAFRREIYEQEQRGCSSAVARLIHPLSLFSGPSFFFFFFSAFLQIEPSCKSDARPVSLVRFPVLDGPAGAARSSIIQITNHAALQLHGSIPLAFLFFFFFLLKGTQRNVNRKNSLMLEHIPFETKQQQKNFPQ